MAHMPRRERIAQIVATLIDSSKPLTAYGIAPRINMSVSKHLYGLLETAFEMGLILYVDAEMPNGKTALLYFTTTQRVEYSADTEMLNAIYMQTKRDDWFIHSGIPF